jgi:hypothetical protein
MARRTTDLKRMLEHRNVDNSDFILIALDILKNESPKDDETFNEAIDAIKRIISMLIILKRPKKLFLQLKN